MRLRQAVRAAARARGAVTTPVTTMTAVTAETVPAKAKVVVPCRVDAAAAMAAAAATAAAARAAATAPLSEEEQEDGSAGSRAECSEAEMVARAAAGEATVPCRVDATAAVAAVC